MPPPRVLILFLLRLALFYGLLSAPWPGAKEAWGSGLRTVASHLLAGNDGQREVTIEPLDLPGNHADTRIVIVNRDLLQSDGSGPVRNLDLSMAQFEMKGAMLLVALILATPISWARRGWSILGGLLLLHGCIFCILSYCIWRESTELLLVDLSPRMKGFTEALQSALSEQSLIALPVLLWLALCLGTIDFRRLSKR